ncbi:MAG: sigma-54-dependent Fis family transcriptional regulator [Acidobacteria bacterium]|nr:sigma-54-dependent Fis family transcriptional regulator [Acidobacteriota bacterium]
MPEVLIVEDDFAFSQTMLALLEAEGFAAEAVNSTADALDRFSARSYPIVISDIYIDERTGLDVLRRARAVEPECAVILITGQGSLDTVLEATRAGAFDYIAKPFPLDRLVQTVRNAANAWAARRQNSLDETATLPGPGEYSPALVGHSDAMVETYKFISRVADSDATVLLQGETGTGKEMVARLIHQASPRRARRMVVVDCGALSGSLLEAELFGATRGAYTGADRDRTGLLEAAEGGTVFLDEIGEMEWAFQQRLLRFLQEREVRPLGSNTAKKVDVRVVAATNCDLRGMVAEKKFREDLWYRLQVATCQLAPLRDRRQDIPELVSFFLAKFARQAGTQTSTSSVRALRFSDDALVVAQQYGWPGNVRQLENLLERLAILHSGAVVDAAGLRSALSAMDPTSQSQTSPHQPGSTIAGPAESLSSLEEDHIRRVLEATRGNKTRAAEILGIERKTLYRKLEKMRLAHS